MRHRNVLSSINAFGLVAILILAGCDMIGGNKTSQHQASEPSVPSQKLAASSQVLTPVSLPSEVLAVVNNVQISKKDLEMRIADIKGMVQNAGQTWKPLAPQQLEQLLDEMIDSEILRQQVIQEGLDKDTDFQRRWLSLQRQLFAQQWINKAQERATVDAAMIEAFYAQNEVGFREPERIQVRELVVGTEEQAKNALSMLYAGSVTFAQLVAQISEGPNKAEGGLVDNLIMRAAELAAVYPSAADAEAAGVMSLDPSLEAVAFAVGQVDGLSNYVKGPDNRYYIFQLVERQEGKQQPLTEVWDNIKTFLTLQQLQAQMDALKGGATIERYTDRIEGIVQ